MSDVWETQYGLNTNNAADALLDADGDGEEQEEYIAGTHPTNALSYLKVDRIAAAPDGVSLEFLAVSNRTYTVEFAEQLANSWSRLGDLGARPTNRLEILLDASGASSRYYRLVHLACRDNRG